MKPTRTNRGLPPVQKQQERQAEAVRGSESNDPDYVNDTSDGGGAVEDQLTVAGMSVEILVIVVIAGLLVLLISVGVVYKCARGRKKPYDDDDDDEDEDDSGACSTFAFSMN